MTNAAGQCWPYARLRRGVTLVEIIVCLAIVVTLLALLVPAIQRVREAANMAVCGMRLRNLGLAAHAYHHDYSRFPPGYLGPGKANETELPALYEEGQWIGHFPLLLPYLEQAELFNQLQVNFAIEEVSSSKWFFLDAARGPAAPHTQNYGVAQRNLSLFRCPSAWHRHPPTGDPSPAGGGTFLGFHVFNVAAFGPFTAAWRDEYGMANHLKPLGYTNYMGVAGCGAGDHPFFNRFEGLYTNRRFNRLGELTQQDGASSTLLYGEVCGTTWERKILWHYAIAWTAGGGMGTYRGLHRGPDAPVISFSSMHRQGVQFCFADGSVRFLRFGATQWDGRATAPEAADWHLLQQLAGRKDGAKVQPDALSD